MFNNLNFFWKLFKIAPNKMIYTMTFLLLPQGSGRDSKRVSEHGFQKPQNTTPPMTEYELNHASKCQTLSVIKSQAKRTFWKEILRRSNYTKIDIIESRQIGKPLQDKNTKNDGTF